MRKLLNALLSESYEDGYLNKGIIRIKGGFY